MWSQIGLCLLVGFAFASQNPGWKENTEYVYSIRGRTLASLHEVANQYSGILLKAKLVIQPRPDGRLSAQISNAQYAQVHSHLSNDWNTHIPDAELSYKPLGMSQSPFQIVMENGEIRDLIVNKAVPNWEANIIKSIMSQFQLVTSSQRGTGEKLTENKESGNTFVFKTMEETITGNTETSYDIHPLPEYVLRNEEWTSRLLDLGGDRNIIEIVKNKNYSNSNELPSYHYGFAGMGNWKPATNQMGDFFIRGSISRAILTGSLDRYTVQNSYTVNKIMMSPTLNNKQKGSVVSFLNVTLEEIKGQKGQNIGEVANPVKLGGLVYTYDDPFSDSNEAGQRKMSERARLDSSDYDRRQRSTVTKLGAPANKIEDINVNNNFWHTNKILRRSSSQGSYDSSDESSEYWQLGAFYKQDQPKLDDVPDFPLLPFTTGYHGKSIKQNKNVNIVQSVKKIAQSIGTDLQNPDEALRQNSLNKYTIMTSLMRIMSKEELMQVAGDLYSQSTQGPQHDSWVAFRDACAEVGTGPAFLTIKNWIESKKIRESEAAKIVATMSKAVRVPTIEFMQSYFDFIKKSEMRSQKYLNETSLMAFTGLVRRVCVDSKQSKNEYPVRTFGSFRTNEAKKIVEGVISYLTEQLSDANSRADALQMQVFIRALGNVAHPNILFAFEPYLEGKKQASQFQRLLMVVAMDKLTETYPEIARSILFNVYQNVGETPEVRVAAVYQLMRTSPPTSMLQRMAFYTNIDSQEHVNAAVKSAIQSAAELEGEEFQYFRSSAQAAKPLLTKKMYGLQHGANYLRSYVIHELKANFKQNFQSIGNDEDYYPKGLEYSMRANMGGLKDQFFKMKAMVSSIQELLHVGMLQTASYKQQMEEQQRNADEQKNKQFSSQKIAQLLNMESDEMEQLEGNFYMELDDYFQQIIAFDNHTVGQMPEVIRQYEEELRNGKEYHYTKLTNSREMAMSFPTEMGLPFLFTYDTPMLYKVTGKLKGVASPQVCQNDKLRQPDTISVQSNMEVTVNYKTNSHLSFFTPFDHQQYISGFDKNFQVHIPLHGKMEVDLKNGQLNVEMNPQDWHKSASLFHYSTWPYTSRKDIKDFKPVSLLPNTHYIHQTNMRSYDKVFGKKDTGMAWHVKINHEREFVSLSWMQHLLQKHGIIGGLLSLWDDAAIQHSEINVRHLADKSSVGKCVFRAGFQQEYKSKPEGMDAMVDPAYWAQYFQQSDALLRQKSLMSKLAAGINNADVSVGEMSLEFQGDKNIKYSVSGGYGKSNVDSRSRVLANCRKNSNSDVKPYEIQLETVSMIPNTNGLDLSYSMQNEPKADTEFRVRFGPTPQTSSEIEGKLAFRRSERRKLYLQEQPLYQQCQREMRKGNYQLPACANTTMSANLLDQVDISIKHDKMKPDFKDACEAVYQALRVNYYPFLESYNKGTGKQNEIHLKARFDPDLRYMNCSVRTTDEESTVNNIEVGEWGRTFFVVHPVFHVKSRIMSNMFGLHTYRPICVLDKTSVSTFKNRTYPADLENHWTVMLQYIPKDARHGNEPRSVQDQLRYQTENYVVLARQSPKGEGKDIKITLSSPETGYKLKDITLSPYQGSGMKVKVTVDGQEVRVNDKQSFDIGNGYVQIYGLPNGEMKVEVRDAFYAISDGQRMKLTVLNGKFRNSARGLCGAFNDDMASDLLTPQGCIARDYKKFIRSYDIEEGQGQKLTHQECVSKDVPLYANVISASERVQRDMYSTDDCIRQQTRYVEQGGQICFTIREWPVCSSHCQARDSTTKMVSVHCVQNSNAAQVWKNQIDQGSSPHFGHKSASKIIKMELPFSCSP